MYKDFITGANKGFIGRHLAGKLRRKKSKLKLLKQDEWQNLAEVISDFAPDRIFHLASFGNHFYQKDFKKTLAVNVIKTFKLFEATQKIAYASFILLGSSSEYGVKKSPMKERDLLEPDTFYGATKAQATLIAQVWAKNFGKPIIIIRPFSIFGPGEGEHRFIPTIIRSCLLGEPMKLDPLAVHDWLYVSDLIDGILLAAERAKDLKGQIINLGSGIQTTNREIVELVEKICGKKANIKEVLETRHYDKTFWVANISKARALGWKLKFKLSDGLVKTVNEYAKIIKRTKS